MRSLKFAVAGVFAAMSLAAAASQTIVAYEIGNSPYFIGNGAPGSTITLTASLRNPNNHAQVIGSKNEWCMITSYSPGPILYCDESLVFNAGGSLFAHGYIDEVALEHFAPQTISVYKGAGIYAGKTGTETIQQVVFPNELLNTLVIN